MALAVSLSALLAACSAPGPSAMVVHDARQADQTFSANTRGGEPALGAANYTTVVPRAYINADEIEVDAPDAYTVVRGDTLWDISDRFLKKPWLWTQIWDYNPQIYNPHLIYPGDMLALEYVNGQPTLVLTRNGKEVPTGPAVGAATETALDADGNPLPQNGSRVRMSPRIRSESLDDAIPTISGDSIQQFLVHPRVVDAQTLANAPYVISNHDDSLISSLGNQIYVRGTISRSQTAYSIYRRSKELIDPVNGALLGYEITHVSDAKLLSVGDPSTLTITDNKMETIAGDILMASNEGTATHQYVPRLPEIEGEARIVSLVNAISQTGRDQVIVLNVGTESGVQTGDVLAIETRGKTVVDPRGTSAYERVTLPNQRTGVLMVFKAFDKVSYGLVMESTRPVLMNDVITGI